MYVQNEKTWQPVTTPLHTLEWQITENWNCLKLPFYVHHEEFSWSSYCHFIFNHTPCVQCPIILHSLFPFISCLCIAQFHFYLILIHLHCLTAVAAAHAISLIFYEWKKLQVAAWWCPEQCFLMCKCITFMQIEISVYCEEVECCAPSLTAVKLNFLYSWKLPAT